MSKRTRFFDDALSCGRETSFVSFFSLVWRFDFVRVLGMDMGMDMDNNDIAMKLIKNPSI